MKKRALLPWLMLYILLSAMPPVKSSACPVTCESGYILRNCKCETCKEKEFLSWRNGEPICNQCTASCADNDQIEVTPCTKTGDRSCRCKPGFFCPSPVLQTCRRRCKPCGKGLFTSTANLNQTCQEYTDCAHLGMVVIKEGSATSDRVCEKPTSKVTFPKPTTTTMLDSTTQKLRTQKPSTFDLPHSQMAFTDTQASSENAPAHTGTSRDPVTSSSSETTAAPSPDAVAAQTQDKIILARITEGPVSPYEPLSKTTWIILLLLIVSLLCLVSCLSLKYKSRSIKDKLRLAGLVYDKYPTACPSASPNPSVQTSVPVSDITDPVREHVQGQGSFPGKNQKVTMEHVGKADGINNTVGSIFIYSPGMVILGSNSNEKKEEAETSGEDSGEDACLISVPQQESSSEEDFVRFATQEEVDKELSIPIPATSK